MATILLVDDSATDRRLARGLLEKGLQARVEEASSGDEALARLHDVLPDVVLTDLQMPNTNGLELIRRLRQENPLIPVVLMTAKGSEELAVQALHEGASSYVPKRLLARELVDTVRRVLSSSRENLELAHLMGHVSCAEYELVLENELPMISSTVQFLREALGRLRLCDEQELVRVAMALDEALLNAYYHGNLDLGSDLRESDLQAFYRTAEERQSQEPFRSRRILVKARLLPQEATFVIRDDGQGFDPAELPDPTDTPNLERPCGRGVMLMRTFMDEVTFNDVGNEVTMVKRVSGETENGPGSEA